MDEPQTTDTFVMDCPNCGPDTYRVEGGVALGCLCDYEPPALVIECGGDDPAPDAQRGEG